MLGHATRHIFLVGGLNRLDSSGLGPASLGSSYVQLLANYFLFCLMLGRAVGVYGFMDFHYFSLRVGA